jgi:hypothetical protein
MDAKEELRLFCEKVLKIDKHSSAKDFGISTHKGICGNVKSYAAVMLQSMALDWPLHSGDSECPIPVTDAGFISPVDQYGAENLWIGKQLEMRQSLCRFVLNKIDAERAE